MGLQSDKRVYTAMGKVVCSNLLIEKDFGTTVGSDFVE
jgi:hypothetical protein